MLSADATLTDWDGQISILDRQAIHTLCDGDVNHQEVRLNTTNGIIQTETKSIKRDTAHIETVNPYSQASRANREQQCDRSSTSKQNALSDQDGESCGAINTIGRNECGDVISRPSSSRFGSYYQQVVTGSSMLADSLTEIAIDDYQNDHEPTSAILDYCKRKVLQPYVAILSLVGLNPISTETSKCRACLSYLQCVLLVITLIFGYFLQYISAYRGDRGFSTTHKNFVSDVLNSSATEASYKYSHTIEEALFGFIIPFSLNLAGYISAVTLCKLIDHEELQNLIERSFLMTMTPKRLCRAIWLHVALALVICCCLYAYVLPVVVTQYPIIQSKWIGQVESKWHLVVKIALLTTLLVQDFIEIIILSSYCIECYLLKVHLLTLSQKLLLHSIDSLDWMREILQFRKLLHRLNNHASLPVSFFVVMNLAYAFSGFVYMFKDFDFHYSALKIVILNFTNVLLWLILGLLPFFMAASLTQVCQSVKANGHQIRVRPFVYHNTSVDDLNSMLMFSSTLDMSAQLFRMPIQSNYICFTILIISVFILTMGMCFNLSVLGIFKL